MSREHNDANVLALGARITAREGRDRDFSRPGWARSFQAGRHARRVDKIVALDRGKKSEVAG
jgi:ribose 5-phosphate isomerase RpiB